MRSRALIRGIPLAVALVLATGAFGGVSAAEVIITDTSNVVRPEHVTSNGSLVTGELVNLSDDSLENVVVLVTDTFAWRNERHPGPESPGQAQDFIVPGPIPPRGRVTFRLERPEPPPRSDGTFDTGVSVLSLTRYATTPTGTTAAY